MKPVSSADLYRWHLRIEAAVPLILSSSDTETLQEREELQAVADDVFEAYLDALRIETTGFPTADGGGGDRALAMPTGDPSEGKGEGTTIAGTPATTPAGGLSASPASPSLEAAP